MSESAQNATDTTILALMSSVEFGGSLEYPGIIVAQSGNVTIDSVSSYAVSGSVDLTMLTGDHVQGSFSIDLQ